MKPRMYLNDAGDELPIPGICYLVNSGDNGIFQKYVTIVTIGDHYGGLMVNIFTGQCAHWSRLDIIREFDLED